MNFSEKFWVPRRFDLSCFIVIYLYYVMFVRKKINRSGSVTVQIIDKSTHRHKIVKVFGTACEPEQIQELVNQANAYLNRGKLSLNFEPDPKIEAENLFLNQMSSSIQGIQLVGPELILGSIFRQIGFDCIKEELFKDLVISRICYPSSKLKTTHYLSEYQGKELKVDRIYRYMDKLSSKQKTLVENQSLEHTKKVLGGKISLVFYDVTTLYFETDTQDDLRKTGFSKEGKHQHPQILLGLLVSKDGYPLAYDIFEGNKFEGHTMIPIIQSFKSKLSIDNVIVVADSGLMSTKNLEGLREEKMEYILGARLKSSKQTLKDKVLALKLSSATQKVVELDLDDGERLVVSYSEKRAKKDAHNRERGLTRLRKSVAAGTLSKENLNNRGYNRFLKIEENVEVSVDENRVSEDEKWDGLKGYQTNTRLSKEAVIGTYSDLWKIERAFRMSKTDLRIRPIYHRLERRIRAHICISFCAYKLYKELERQLKEKKVGISVEKAIDIMKTIYQLTILTPHTHRYVKHLIINREGQKKLLDSLVEN